MSNNYENDIQAGRQVLKYEADSIIAMAEALDDTFGRVLDQINAIKGRVIVTGMGKSGHIGKKIAATLASTGTPSFFVHPGEASHGDLGMVTENDMVLAISNSGEAPELSDILAFCKRWNIPQVGITSRPGSSLDKTSDITLFIPNIPEACPNNLAPTNSTTLTLAMGDAIAIALMKRRNFTSTEYKEFHPGGKLGKRLLKVGELMHTNGSLPIVTKDTPMKDVLVTMSQKGFGCALVCDDNDTLLGLISDGDLRRHMSDDFTTMPAGQVMTANPRTIEKDSLAAEALSIMNAKSITFLIVAHPEGKLEGLVRMHDILRAGVA